MIIILLPTQIYKEALSTKKKRKKQLFDTFSEAQVYYQSHVSNVKCKFNNSLLRSTVKSHPNLTIFKQCISKTLCDKSVLKVRIVMWLQHDTISVLSEHSFTVAAVFSPIF